MEEKQLFKLVGAGNTESQEKIEKPTLSFTQDAWRRLKKNKLATISLWFLAILLVFSIGSNFFVNAKDANSFNGDEVKTYRNLPPKLSDAYHSGMVVLYFQVIRSLMMCTLINQFQKTINLFWELTIWDVA